MGTKLDARGVDTRSALWSALALTTVPDVVCEVHSDYLDAGARVITNNTYQATLPALIRSGKDAAGARDTIAAGVRLAKAAAWAAKEAVVVAVGINCVAPGVVGRALPMLHAAADKPLVAYPNASDFYCVVSCLLRVSDVMTSQGIGGVGLPEGRAASACWRGVAPVTVVAAGVVWMYCTRVGCCWRGVGGTSGGWGLRAVCTTLGQWIPTLVE